MNKLFITIFLSLICPTLSIAELLKVSADGTVHLSTDSIEIKQNKKGKYVSGIIYINENGVRNASPFAASCGKRGGSIAFRQGDGSMGEEHAWSPTGNSAFDSIAGTACKVAGLL